MAPCSTGAAGRGPAGRGLQAHAGGEQPGDHRVVQVAGDLLGLVVAGQLLLGLGRAGGLGDDLHPHRLHRGGHVGHLGRPGRVHRVVQVAAGHPAHLGHQPVQRPVERGAQHHDGDQAEQQGHGRGGHGDLGAGGVHLLGLFQLVVDQLVDPAGERAELGAQHVEQLLAAPGGGGQVGGAERAALLGRDVRLHRLLLPGLRGLLDPGEQGQALRVLGQVAAQPGQVGADVPDGGPVGPQLAGIVGQQVAADPGLLVDVGLGQPGHGELGRPQHGLSLGPGAGGGRLDRGRGDHADQPQQQHRGHQQPDPPLERPRSPPPPAHGYR
jgi:hypothetical protein